MESGVFQLVLKHLNLRPLMQTEDIYKLLYQACMGLGHLLDKQEHVLAFLAKEMNTPWDHPPDEQLLEDISLVHPLVRVNLRPYTRVGLTANVLFQAMLETENAMHPSKEKLKEAWEIYCNLDATQRFPGKRHNLPAFHDYLLLNDYPVQHHSVSYRQHYFPSYRIVDLQILSRLVSCEKDFLQFCRTQ